MDSDNIPHAWMLEELYNCSKNEMKDKLAFNEVCLLISAVGLINDKQPRTEYRRILTRAVLNASYYDDASEFYKVDIKNLLNRIDKLRESQSITLIIMIQEVIRRSNVAKLDVDKDRIHETFFHFFG